MAHAPMLVSARRSVAILLDALRERPVFDSEPANLVLAVCCAFYFAAFLLYHFMVFRVNRNLPGDDKIPHSLTFGQRDRLAKEYKILYPKSILYQLTLLCAVTMFALAALFAVIRIWKAARGR